MFVSIAERPPRSYIGRCVSSSSALYWSAEGVYSGARYTRLITPTRLGAYSAARPAAKLEFGPYSTKPMPPGSEGSEATP